MKDQKKQVAVKEKITFRAPREDDGKGVWRLVRDTGVLDLNSSYSYLMWSKYFSDTSVVVESDEQIVGFISGFIQPSAPDTLFVWQIAVDDEKRGQGLASRMLQSILHRGICRNVQYLEATVTPSNGASQALFRKLARDLQVACEVSECFTERQFPEEGHEAELLFKIGPFQQE